MKNFFISTVMLLLLVVGQVNVSSAYGTTSDNNISIGVSDDGVPVINAQKVTIDDATKYVYEKGNILVGFIQNIAKPITVVVMVISGLIAIITSLVGGKDGASKWFGGFIISALCYVGVMFAPLLLQLLIGFASPI